MPILTIETNVPKGKVPADFVKTTSVLLAKTLNKPEGFCIVHLKPGQEHITFGGTTDPCGYGTLMSIGQLGTEKNKQHSAVLYKHLQEKLGIPPDRLYINFVDAKPSDVGWNGSTFDGIL